MRVAVIPARGGSKRVLRKNIRSFAGKPMIAYSIEAAIASGLFDRVIVSTDDAEIARVAEEHGADIPFLRPATLADDVTGTTDVIIHAIEWLQSKGAQLSAVCCIYATAPFIRKDDLRSGLDVLKEGSWRFVFSATTYGSPVHRAFHCVPGGGLRMLFPEHFDTRSQDLPQVWHDAGQFYWASSSAWLARDSVFDQHSTIVHVPRWCVQDIDTEEDWKRAEAMASYLGLWDRHS